MATFEGKPVTEAETRKFAGTTVEPTKTAQAPTDTPLERFGTGLRDPLEGGAQLLTHVLPTDIVRYGNELNNWLRKQGVPLAEMPTTGDVTLDKYEQEREKRIQAGRGGQTGLDPYRLAGGVASPVTWAAPGARAIGGVSKLAEAAYRGITAAAQQPVAGGTDYAREKEKQALWGAAFGGLGGAAGKAISKTVAPVAKKAQQALLSAGVEMTPGQIVGGILRRAEEAAKSFPILGSFIRGAEGRSIHSFNKAVINQALDPIGEKLPGTVTAGHDAVAYAQHRLSNAYESLLPKLSMHIDDQFVNDMRNIRTAAQELPPDLYTQAEKIVDNRLGQRLRTGNMDGQTLKQVESELGHVASNYRRSSDAAQRELASVLTDVQAAVRGALERQNPQYAGQLRKLNQAWAMFTRVQSAASGATKEGVFTSADLLRAVRTHDKSVRKGDFARGDALMQEFAEWGQLVLPGKLPDSGTPERAMWDMLGLGTAIVKPEIPAALGAVSLAYTAPVTRAVSRYVRAGPTRQAAAKQIEEVSPYLGPPAALTRERREPQR